MLLLYVSDLFIYLFYCCFMGYSKIFHFILVHVYMRATSIRVGRTIGGLVPDLPMEKAGEEAGMS